MPNNTAWNIFPITWSKFSLLTLYLLLWEGILVFMLEQSYSIQKLLCFSFFAALAVGSEWTIQHNYWWRRAGVGNFKVFGEFVWKYFWLLTGIYHKICEMMFHTQFFRSKPYIFLWKCRCTCTVWRDGYFLMCNIWIFLWYSDCTDAQAGNVAIVCRAA